MKSSPYPGYINYMSRVNYFNSKDLKYAAQNIFQVQSHRNSKQHKY